MFNKIAILSALACAAVSADSGFYRGACAIKNSDGDKIGRLAIKQDSGESEPVRVSAKVDGLMHEANAIRVFSEDPSTMPEQEEDMCLGSWWLNKQDKLAFWNQYRNDITLQGDDSLEGKYIGVISLEDGHLCGSCKLRVKHIHDLA